MSNTLLDLANENSWNLLLDESKTRSIASVPIAPFEITNGLNYQFLRVAPTNPMAKPTWELGAWLYWLTNKTGEVDILQRKFVKVNYRNIFESPNIVNSYQLVAVVPKHFSQINLKIWGAIFKELSLYKNSDLPSGSESDASYELGIKLFFSINGFIKAIRYYKPIGETGAHIGKIWDANGSLLASVTFTNESSSGWQEQELDTPLSVSAFNQYVISVNANTVYAQTSQGLLSQKSNTYIYSVADNNNGVFNTNVDNFPQNSYANTDYYRDIVFTQSHV